MSVSDLSGTRWLINTGTFNNSAFDTTITFNIHYAIPNSTDIWKDNCDALGIGPTSITLNKQNAYTNRSNITYDNERLWYIFDGRDVTNPELIAWFELNAVQQEFESEDYLTNTYDLTQVANTIRKTTKNYTLMSYPSGMVDTLNNMGDFWTIEQLMSDSSLGDLYYNGSITTIPSGAFTYKKIITASFPNCISIGGSAFQYCSSLATVSFPKCTDISQCAFAGCTKLTSVNFPECTFIGYLGFSYCYRLSTISFPKCISIGSYAFQQCTSLTTVLFPNCTSIGNYAFYDCSKLTIASFPSCISINERVFFACSSLTTVSFPLFSNILQTETFRNCFLLSNIYMPLITGLGAGVFSNCSALSIINFSYLSFISQQAFRDCRSLSEVVLPTLTSISGYSAFYYCTSLLSFNLTGVSTVPSLQYSNAFSYTPIAGYTTSTGGVYGSIYVPASLYDAFTSATNWTYFSSRMVSV